MFTFTDSAFTASVITTPIIHTIFVLFSAIFFSVWRRWYGGGFKSTWLKNNRAMHCVVFLVANLLICYHFTSNIYLILAIDLWLYAQFWSRGHGACFDIGRGIPSEDTIRRYNERWYHYPLDLIFKPEKRYGISYDFWYMMMRYSCPMLPLAFVDLKFLLVGFLVSPIYDLCWTMKDRNYRLINKFNRPTDLAEYIAGGLYGLILAI